MTLILVNIGSGNGLLPDGTKPIPKPMLTYHQRGYGIHLWVFSKEILKISLIKLILNITFLKLLPHLPGANKLTHWGRVTHICVNKLAIISSDNGLSPGRRQAIIWTNVGILLIGPLGPNFSEILIEI